MAGILNIRPVSEHIGADVSGMQISEIVKNPRALEEVKAAMQQHLVLRFGGQALEPADMVAFTRQFGPLQDALNKKEGMYVPGHENIGILSDYVDDKGNLVAKDTLPQVFHTDKTSKSEPAAYYATYTLRVPAEPPVHTYVNMHKVYDSLAPALKKRIETLRIVHHSYNRGVDIDRADSPSLPLEQRAVGVQHPMVRRHAITGKPSLFLCYRRDAAIPGLSETEARALMDELWGITEASPYQWSNSAPQYREQAGELLMLDLRCTKHRRTGWKAGGRLFWSVSCKGEVPVPAFAPAAVAADA
jgi:taurine dioxygenase